MGIRTLLFGKSSSSGNAKLRGKSYDSAVALDPPVKGLYPVAGNGPNVLDELRRSRLKKDASRRQSTASTAAPAPIVPRWREDITERPRTAPHNGRPGGGYTSGTHNDAGGRTRSGFSVNSPPSFFSSSARNSMRSTVEPPPPIPASTPTLSNPKPREIKTYRPKRATEPVEADIPNIFTPQFALHQRSASQISHRSYVDLLEAHSNIRPSHSVSKHRAKASGVRNYGEDVADRNIADFGEQRLDLNSPEFSYLRSVYKNGGVAVSRDRRSHSLAASALGHGLGQEYTASDDIKPRNQTKANSTRFPQSNSSRTGIVYPPRTDSTSALSYSANRGRDVDRSSISNDVHDHRGRALSPTTASIHEELEDISQEPIATSRSTPPPPIPARGRARTWTRDCNPPPVSPSPSLPRAIIPAQTQQVFPVASAPSLKRRRRTMSEASQSSVTSTGTKSRTRSGSFSVSATSPQDYQSGHHPAAREEPNRIANKKSGMIVEGIKELPSLEGVVDLTNTVDTDGTTRTLPAVTHEKVLPTRHEIREERIIREIHNHDVFHRILPVIETEILPPKHYVPSADGKGLIKIPELMIPGRTTNGSSSRNWQIVETGMGRGDHGSTFHRKTPSKQSRRRSQSLTQSNYSHSHANIDEEDGADGPVIGLTREEPKASQWRASSLTSTHSRGNFRTPTHTPNSPRTRNVLEPILSSKKEYITKEGYPKIEYVWRHPPVFERAMGQTQRIYIGAGVGDLSSPTTAPVSAEAYYSSDEDDVEGAEFGAMRRSADGEEGLLFRDSGYGSPGMLPGLAEKAPLAGLDGVSAFDPTDFEVIRLGRVVGEGEDLTDRKAKGVEGEATKALRRMKERRSSAASSASTVIANGSPISQVERGINGLGVRD